MIKKGSLRPKTPARTFHRLFAICLRADLVQSGETRPVALNKHVGRQDVGYLIIDGLAFRLSSPEYLNEDKDRI